MSSEMAIFDFDAARSSEKVFEFAGRWYVDAFLSPVAIQALQSQQIRFPYDSLNFGYPADLKDTKGRSVPREFYGMQNLVDSCIGHAALFAEVDGIAVCDTDGRVRASTVMNGLYANSICNVQKRTALLSLLRSMQQFCL